MKIKNWYLTVNPRSHIFITTEDVKLFDGDVYIYGQIERTKNNSKIYFSGKIKTIDDKSFTTFDNKLIELGHKMDMYQKFEDNMSKNIPIIYNWTIGKIEDELYIVGKTYEDQTLFDLKDKIIDQDIEEGTLLLEQNKLVFVVWGSFSKYQRYLLLDNKEILNDLLESKPFNIKENLELSEDLIDIDNNLLFGDNNAKKLEKYKKYIATNKAN